MHRPYASVVWLDFVNHWLFTIGVRRDSPGGSWHTNRYLFVMSVMPVMSVMSVMGVGGVPIVCVWTWSGWVRSCEDVTGL